MSWNPNNPSVRRILADVRELARDPSDQYAAHPLEENMFDWHFVIRGPKGTEYEGGVYHGRIVLPKDYPFKPPSIMLLTPNGRWEIKQKICLSISSYHPEQWQPAWGIRTILEALISFMETPAEGAVGALDCSAEVRKKLARESLSYTHPLMPTLPPLREDSAEPNPAQDRYAKQIAQIHVHNLSSEADKDKEQESETNKTSSEDPIAEETENSEINQESADSNVDISADSCDAKPPSSSDQVNNETIVESNDVGTQVDPPMPIPAPVSQSTPSTQTRQPRVSDSTDTFLHHLSIALMMAIFAILYRKALQLYA